MTTDSQRTADWIARELSNRDKAELLRPRKVSRWFWPAVAVGIAVAWVIA